MWLLVNIYDDDVIDWFVEIGHVGNFPEECRSTLLMISITDVLDTMIN